MKYFLLPLLIFLGSVFTQAVFSDTDITPERSQAWKTIADTGNGYLVWESSRTGAWRIWKRDLDGSNLKQLTSDESGRNHYCPHISPDGKRILYISYPNTKHAYEDHVDNDPNMMHLMSSDGRFDRVIIQNVRAYGEDRGAVWIDNDRFIYIDGKGITSEFSISSGISKPISKQTKEGYGWLVNAQKTFAVPGWPASFNPFDANSGKITQTRDLGGCQPYFTPDGKWGFWMGRGGGPINRYELATGKISPILTRNDHRMPKDRNYLYFPMISSNMRLFVFAASPNQHDHFDADYDIFAAKIDPNTMEIIGEPVRYTFDPACDRFPDAYVEELVLGEISGEAPFTAKFSIPDQSSGEWNWNFGDGWSGKGNSVNHLFSKPGEYLVRAENDGIVLKGRVVAYPTLPPILTSASLAGKNTILIRFNEPIDISKASFKLASKNKIKTVSIDSAKQMVALVLAADNLKNDKLTVSGIKDLAEKPNTMAEKTIDIRMQVWPVNKTDLVFLWTNKAGISSSSNELFKLMADGRAAYDNNFSMLLKGGSFKIPGLNDYLTKTLSKSNKFSIETVIRVKNIDQEGPARIISLSENPNSRNFTLGQNKSRLILRLRTPITGNNGTDPETDLCEISAGKPLHLIVSYSPGNLVCFADGKKVLDTKSIRGDFSNWGDQEFIIGNEWTGDRAWFGMIDTIGIYSRTFTADEAHRSYEGYKALYPIKSLAPISVSAKLISSSRIPVLNEIKPYREGLVLNEYKVLKSNNENIKTGKIRVAHWAILGERNVLRNDLKTGAEVEMNLTLFNANPQLESVYMSDTLEIDPDIPTYYDIDF